VQSKYVKKNSCCSANHVQLYAVRAKTGWLRVRIMCPSRAICISQDCCFSVLWASTKNVNSACWPNKK